MVLGRLQPFEFVAGQPVSGAGVRKINDGANGLFTGTGGPKPPVALSRAVLGMKKGGKVRVVVAWRVVVWCAVLGWAG